jgi:hypothetical protein
MLLASLVVSAVPSGCSDEHTVCLSLWPTCTPALQLLPEVHACCVLALAAGQYATCARTLDCPAHVRGSLLNLCPSGTSNQQDPSTASPARKSPTSSQCRHTSSSSRCIEAIRTYAHYLTAVGHPGRVIAPALSLCWVPCGALSSSVKPPPRLLVPIPGFRASSADLAPDMAWSCAFKGLSSVGVDGVGGVSTVVFWWLLLSRRPLSSALKQSAMKTTRMPNLHTARHRT